MTNNRSKGKRKPHDDTGEEHFREGKIGSGYMSFVKGQPFLRETVKMTSKRDHEIRPRETKE